MTNRLPKGDTIATIINSRLYELAPGIVSILSGPDHLVEFVNAAHRQAFDSESWVGKSVREVIPELGEQGFFKLLDEVLLSGKAYSAEGAPVFLPDTNGNLEQRYFDFVFAPIRDESGLVTGVYSQSFDVTETLKIQRELKDSNRRFEAAVVAVEGYIWTNDAAGRMIGKQPAWERLTGQSFEDYQGYGWGKAVHPEDVEPTIVAWNAAVATQTTFTFEHRLRMHDGEWRHFSVRAVPVVKADGSVQEWVGVHTDITERRKADLALREETRLLKLLNESGASIASKLDLQDLVQSVTDMGVSITGAQFGAFFYNAYNASGEAFLLYTLSGADRSQFEKFGMPRATAIFKPTFEGSGVIRSDDILKDPRYGKNAPHSGMPKGHLPVRSYLAVPVVSRLGEVIGGLFFGHPKVGQFLERHESLIVGIAGQAATAIDNARLYQALQKSNDTLEQRVAEEITERSKTEEALRQSQKMEAIGQLTGGVAHDFNNLLTIIKSSTELLRRPGLDEERKRRYIDAIADTVGRAARLTGQLLAFARRQALKPELFDVAPRIHSITDMLRAVLGSRIAISVREEGGPHHVHADVAQFETALVNLAVNARDAMQGSGELEVIVASASPNGREGEVASDFVVISVSDTGCGIPSDKLKQIFEPFFTTKEVGRGTGLGLSQVYGFLKQSGGEVTVTSKPGVGSTFTLFLPKHHDARIALPTVELAALADDVWKGRRILVVEDNPEVGKFARQLLEDLGYQTSLAANGEEALAVLRSDPAFDIVFSDVMMPGMSGVELGKAIKKSFPQVPVVLTSGYSEALLTSNQHGFDLLQKPYAVEDLSNMLRKVWRQHKYAAPL